MKFLIVFALCVVGAFASFHCDNSELVQKAWYSMRHEEIDILYSAFKAYPDIQAKFPKFAGKDLEELKGTAPFAVHATRIVNFMFEIIALITNDDNTPAIQTLLTQLGKEHKERGVTVKNFDDFHVALNDFLHSHTSVWTDTVDAAWHCHEKEIRKLIDAALV